MFVEETAVYLVMKSEKLEENLCLLLICNTD